MKTICIVDTETTGLDPNRDQVIEVAAVRFQLEHAAVIETFAALIEADSNPVEHINRIPEALVANHGLDPDYVWSTIAGMISNSDCVLAHNASFDKSFIEPRIGAEGGTWVCSIRDLEWPEKSDSKKLTELALAHGVPIIGAHRALTDVDILVRLLQRVREQGADLVAMFKYAITPKPLLMALVPFERKDEAKAANFLWNSTAKRWERRMTLDEARRLPFKVREISP